MKSLAMTALAMCLLSTSLMAQVYLEYQMNAELRPSSFFYYDYFPGLFKPDAEVKEVTFQEQRGKRNITTVRKFQNKQTIELKRTNKKGEMQLVYQRKFNEDGRNIENKTYRKGELKHTTRTEFLNKKDAKSEIRIDEDGETIYTKDWVYDAEGKLTESTYTRKDDEVPTSKWIYAYNADGDRINSKFYNKKGKHKYTWSFECKSEGEKLEKKKDETQVCRWMESEDNMLIKVSQTFDEKGRLVKTVGKYSLPDTVIVESASYNKDDQLIYKTTFLHGTNKASEYVNYKNGKERFRQKTQYENELAVKIERWYKSKPNGRTEYAYESEKLKEIRQFNKHEHMYSKTELAYKY